MGEYDQRPQMEDPTMVGTLEMQAQMIWPLERPLLEASGIGAARRIVDLGCGTGRIAGRVAAAWPEASVLGVDLCAAHLEVARADHPPSTHPNLTFRECDARNTGLAGADFDAVLVRHVLHALGDRELLLAEARRLLRPGGLLHVLAEDYQGLLFDTPREDDQLLFREAREALLPTGTDLDHGRRAFRDVVRAGFVDVRVHPLIVDVQNADRGVR